MWPFSDFAEFWHFLCDYLGSTLWNTYLALLFPFLPL